MSKKKQTNNVLSMKEYLRQYLKILWIDLSLPFTSSFSHNHLKLSRIL